MAGGGYQVQLGFWPVIFQQSPVITTSPTNQSVAQGSVASLSVAASGAQPFSYQWLFNGTNIAGGTSSSLLISPASFANQGNYSVVVANAYGSVTSSEAVLTVTCPTITVSPSSLPAATLNQLYSQNLSASGGAGTNTFSILTGSLPTGMVLSSAGVLGGIPTVGGNFNFTVLATDTNGCTRARAYALSVVTPPSILVPPANFAVGSGGSATFTVGALGTPPFSYQWQLNGVDISGANGSSYSVPSADGTKAGAYTVVVCNAGGCITSPAGSLTLVGFDIHPVVHIYGPIGATYRVDYSEDLGTPTNWITITNFVLPSSPYLFPDPTPARQLQRFYRVMKQ